MSRWADRAASLQRGVRSEEYERAGLNQYGDDEVRRSIVHSREDIVLLVGHLDAVNSQLRTIKWLLTAIACFVAYWVLR